MGLTAAPFQLLLACCRSAIAARALAEVERLAGQVTAEQLAALARRHRVQGLVRRGLARSGADLAAAFPDLEADARAIIAHNLRSAAECARLNAAFDRAGVQLLFVKGLALGALAYPEPLLKMSWDIDILVAPGDVERAAKILRDSAYAPVVPGSIEAIPDWHLRSKESVWRGNDDIHVELHSRLVDSPALISAIGMGSPRQEVEVAPGVTLPTLADLDLLTYVCVHGAWSAWFRLKWLCDFAALLARLPAPAVAAWYEQAATAGAARAAAQGLLLADEFLGMRLPPALDGLRGNRANRRLVALARAELLNPRQPTERPLGTVGIHLAELMLIDGWRSRAAELARQARATADRVSGR